MIVRVRGPERQPAFVGQVGRPRRPARRVRARRGGARARWSLVGGEAGVGKSRLVGEAAAHARRQGARVLVGQCLDLEEGGLPYAPLVDMLRTLDRELTPDEGAATLGPLRAVLGRAGERPATPSRRRARRRRARSARPGCSSCCSP